jgi:hypothetical protein
MATLADLVGAAEKGKIQVVRDALDSGVPIDGRIGKETALTRAAWRGHADIVRLLVSRGADLTVREGTGRTPLELARHGQRAEVERILLEEHARRGIPHSAPEAPVAVPKPPADTETWLRAGEATVARQCLYPGLGKKLTDLFNFSTRERLVIADDLDTKAQSVTTPASFDDIPPAVLKTAFAEFTRLGGKADLQFVLHGASALDKTRKPGL